MTGIHHLFEDSLCFSCAVVGGGCCFFDLSGSAFENVTSKLQFTLNLIDLVTRPLTVVQVHRLLIGENHFLQAMYVSSVEETTSVENQLVIQYDHTAESPF